MKLSKKFIFISFKLIIYTFLLNISLCTYYYDSDFGYSVVGIQMANAYTAGFSNPSSVLYNPAVLGIKKIEVEFSWYPVLYNFMRGSTDPTLYKSFLMASVPFNDFTFSAGYKYNNAGMNISNYELRHSVINLSYGFLDDYAIGFNYNDVFGSGSSDIKSIDLGIKGEFFNSVILGLTLHDILILESNNGGNPGFSAGINYNLGSFNFLYDYKKLKNYSESSYGIKWQFLSNGYITYGRYDSDLWVNPDFSSYGASYDFNFIKIDYAYVVNDSANTDINVHRLGFSVQI